MQCCQCKSKANWKPMPCMHHLDKESSFRCFIAISHTVQTKTHDWWMPGPTLPVAAKETCLIKTLLCCVLQTKDSFQAAGNYNAITTAHRVGIPQTESPSLSDCSNGLSCHRNAPKLGSYKPCLDTFKIQVFSLPLHHINF